MDDWLSYRPENFLLFAPRTYWRLFELQNAASWPLAPAALLAGLLVVAWLLRPAPRWGRAVGLVLAAAWLWSSWAFLWQRYVPINWAAAYAVPLFGLQAALLLWIGVARDRLRPGADWRRVAGTVLAAYAVAGHPFIGLAAGRPLAGAEVFGLAPDPTAMATLGVLAATGPAGRGRLLMAVPALWCLASFLTLRTMDEAQAWVPLAAVAAAVAAVAWPHRGRGVR